MELSFFLGLPLDVALDDALAKAPAYSRTLFTSGDPYLKELTIEGARFLGKLLLPLLTIEELESQEIHIKSLLKKLFSNSSFVERPLLLISLLDESGRDSHPTRRGGQKAR